MLFYIWCESFGSNEVETQIGGGWICNDLRLSSSGRTFEQTLAATELIMKLRKTALLTISCNAAHISPGAM